MVLDQHDPKSLTQTVPSPLRHLCLVEPECPERARLPQSLDASIVVELDELDAAEARVEQILKDVECKHAGPANLVSNLGRCQLGIAPRRSLAATS